ncbi:MAG: putative DNA binding domain-containing protein [Roseiflexus sp.]|nr:putative DNA binding domain-containing protein [Roseiflexus sp.]
MNIRVLFQQPMTLQELLDRIHRGENLHTEFKEAEVHPDDIAAELVAFANTDGGQLIFGVTDDGRIAGVADSDRLAQRVDQIAYNNCEPPITVVQETVRDDTGRTVLIVNVPKGDQRPYQTKQRGDFFIRTSSGRRRVSRQELLRLFQSAESLYYDETLLVQATLADLGGSAIERFMQQAYQRSVEESGGLEVLLRKLRLAREHAGTIRPTVAAMLFFGYDPQRFLPQSHLAAARIPGTDLSAAPSDAKQIGGRLLDILEDARRFLNIHLATAHRIRDFEPEVSPELPPEALRELLVNALAHRDYTITAPVRVFVFDDHVEIRTPGGLPTTVTIDAIQMGAAHVLRNPTVYTLFSRWGLVTGVGSGVYRAMRLIRQATGRDPELFVAGNEFVVSMARPSS